MIRTSQMLETAEIRRSGDRSKTASRDQQIDHEHEQGPAVQSEDPLARLDAERVLRCHDEETGWQWYYDVVDDRPMRYHEREGCDPTPTSRTIVAETAALENVIAHPVSRAHLEIARGER